MKLRVDWHNIEVQRPIEPALKCYRRFLEDKGIRPSTIDMYVFRVGKYLEFAKTDAPSVEDFDRFREALRDRNLSRSTLNNYSFAIKKYHEMISKPVDFKFIRPNNIIPHYLDELDITKIFSVITNIKHLAMLQVMFFASLRASELCDLDDSDLDMKNLTVRVRNGKGGKQAIVYITDECASTLKKYLAIRPVMEINDRRPLFYTDFGNRWDRRDLYRMFQTYKKRAGVEKQAGLHVFSRHSFGSLLVKRGCDILTIKELMRHSNVVTTMRYLHISDTVKREKYEKCLTL